MMRQRLLPLLLLPLALCTLEAQTRTPAFIENNGQWADDVRFKLRLEGLTMWITDRGAVYDLQERVETIRTLPILDPFLSNSDRPTIGEERVIRGHVVGTTFAGAAEKSRAVGLGLRKERENYIDGTGPSQRGRNCRSYSSVRLENLYEGIDVVYYLDEGMPRYDLIVAAGADPSHVRMTVVGADDVRLASNGRLAMATSLGDLEMGDLLTYQRNAKGERCQVTSRFVVGADRSISFDIGAYDATRPLVVDPLVYSTFFGGTGSDGLSKVMHDAEGNIYLYGRTGADDFPTTPGAYSRTDWGAPFITKLDPAARSVLFSTYIRAKLNHCDTDALGIDALGAVYIAGRVSYPDSGGFFPITENAFKTASDYPSGYPKGFLLKLSSAGDSLIYSTFFEHCEVKDLAIDADGNLCAVGYVGGPFGPRPDHPFPTTPGAYDRLFNGGEAFVSKLNRDGSALIFSTFLGGTGVEWASVVAIDASGGIYVAGLTSSPSTVEDVPFPTTSGALHEATPTDGSGGFLSKLSPDGRELLYSTLIDSTTNVNIKDIAVNRSGEVYIAGWVDHLPHLFEKTSGAYDTTYGGGDDCIVLKIGADGDRLLFSTYFGGRGNEQGHTIVVDPSGRVFLAGTILQDEGYEMPTSPNAFDVGYNGKEDVFLMALSPDGGELLYATYLGGSETDIPIGLALDVAGNVTVVGTTTSLFDDGDDLFPVTDDAYDNTPDPTFSYDIFLSRFTLTSTAVLSSDHAAPTRLDLD